MTLPWQTGILSCWAIIAMNHYRVGGVRYLYVAMKQGNTCIISEGTQELDVFYDLERKAKRILEDQINDNKRTNG